MAPNRIDFLSSPPTPRSIGCLTGGEEEESAGEGAAGEAEVDVVEELLGAKG